MEISYRFNNYTDKPIKDLTKYTNKEMSYRFNN